MFNRNSLWLVLILIWNISTQASSATQTVQPNLKLELSSVAIENPHTLIRLNHNGPGSGSASFSTFDKDGIYNFQFSYTPDYEQNCVKDIVFQFKPAPGLKAGELGAQDARFIIDCSRNLK
jgi:hypothetical protein